MNIEEDLMQLIANHTGIQAGEISREMFLEDDLGSTGDDASELIEALQEKFSLDMNSFDLSLYFAPEAGHIRNPEYGYYPVSVGHLIRVCELKSWFKPNRNPEKYLKFKRAVLIQRALGIGLLACILIAALLAGPEKCA